MLGLFVTITFCRNRSRCVDGRISSISFAHYKCTGLIVPGTFTTQDLALQKINVHCFGDDLFHFDKTWLMEETRLSESIPVRVLLRGLKKKVDLEPISSTGFHAEKQAFLEVAKILEFFCTKITRSKETYGTSKLEGNKSKIVFDHLGMGVAETWRGTPDGRLRGSILDDVPVMGFMDRKKTNSLMTVRLYTCTQPTICLILCHCRRHHHR